MCVYSKHKAQWEPESKVPRCAQNNWGKPQRRVTLKWMVEEDFARRSRRWNEHLQKVGSRCKYPETEECMGLFFSPRKRCPGICLSITMAVRLILQWGRWEHWAGETKIRLFNSTHLCQWAWISWWPHSWNRKHP